MTKTINPKIIEKFENPLKELAPSLRSKYRNSALKSGLIKILIGLTIIIIGSAINGNNPGSLDSHSRYVGVPDILAIIAVILPIYGLLELVTIKNRMVDRARIQILAEHPELEVLEIKRVEDLSRKKSNFLKYFTFSLVGLLILGSIIFAIYASLSY